MNFLSDNKQIYSNTFIKQKSVCHLTSVHSRNDIRIFLKQCSSLANAGYNVSLIVADSKGDEIKNGVKIIDAGVKASNRLLRMTRTVSKIYKKAKEIDAEIYHFHDPELIPIGLKLKQSGKTVIYDVHEDYSEDILNKGWIVKPLRNIIADIFEYYESYAAKKLDAIVTATPHIKKKFKPLNSNTFDINNYPILNSSVFNDSNKTIRQRKINYVGAIGGIRGIFEMIRALEFIDTNLILAGTFSTNKDYELAKSMKGWKKVDYQGQVDRTEVEKILVESLAGLVLYHPGPNHNNCQPNKLFEYMAAGLPVIASNFPLWKEIVEKNKCGICVNPLNPEEIADAINWLMQNQTEASLMGKNGLRAVLEKYNWEAESHKLIRFYDNLLKR